MRLFYVLLTFLFVLFAAGFSDVRNSDNEVSRVIHDTEIFKGYPDNTFRPDQPITAYETALVLKRSLDLIFSSAAMMDQFSDEELIQLLRKMDRNDKIILEYEKRLKNAEEQLYETGKEAALLKQSAAKILAGAANNKNIQLSGDLSIRFQDLSYSHDSVDQVFNNNATRQLLGFNLDCSISENLSGFIRFESKNYWNSTGGSWSEGDISSGNRNEFNWVSAYIRAENLPHTGGNLTAGRQKVIPATGLMGRGNFDGIVYEKNLYRDFSTRFSALKNDDSFSDGSSNDNDGFDLVISEWEIDLGKMMTGFYLINTKNPWGNTAAFPGSARTQDQFRDSLSGRQRYYGFYMKRKIHDRVGLYGEYSALRWEEDLMLENGMANGSNACQIGLNLDLGINSSAGLRYTRFGKYFASTGIYENDTWTFPEEDMLHHQAGFDSNFEDIMAELKLGLNDISQFTARYEEVQDKRLNSGIIPRDRRNIFTGIFNVRYRPNTALSLSFRKVKSSQGDVPAEGLAGDSALGYIYRDSDNDGVSDFKNQLLLPLSVDDMTMLRLQMDISW